MECRCAGCCSGAHEIGPKAFPITPSEASNGSQCVIKWSLSCCECRLTLTSAEFSVSTIFCAGINNMASLLIYLKCPSICAWLLRAWPTVRNTEPTIMCSSAPAGRMRCSQRTTREEKSTGCVPEFMWLLLFDINNVYETKCKTKWQKMTCFSATLKHSRGWSAFICRGLCFLKIIVNQP